MNLDTLSAPDLVACLAGELLTLPQLVLEAIKEDEETLAMVRAYGRREASYADIFEKVSELI